MRRIKILIVGFVVVITAAGCSTMDDVKVSHSCDGPVTVLIDQIQVDGVGSRYVAETWSEVTGPDGASVVAGIVNMGSEDLVALYVDISGWRTALTRSELRERDGLITLPLEACP
jgi:hypothetical protein